MAEEQAKPAHIKEIVKRLTDVDIFASAAQNKVDHSTRKVNIAESLMRSIKHEMSYKGETLWGLMSGVTQFTTHEMSAPKRDNARVESKLVGSAQHMDAMAFEYLDTFVS
jgi:hypothetical protein